MAFAAEKRKHRPAKLAVLVDLEHGNTTVDVDTFETAWTAPLIDTGQAVAISLDSLNKTKGNYANKWQFFRGHNMDNTQLMGNSSYMSVSNNSLMGRTKSPTLDLSDKNSIIVKVRSDTTGGLLRFGMGEATSTEFLQDLTSIVTTGQFVSRLIDISNVANASKNAIAYLRFQFLGSTGGLGRNVMMQLDQLESVNYKRYANFAIRFREEAATPQGAIPYKIYSPKLVQVGSVAHALRSVEAKGQLASLSLGFANQDGEFYRLRDTDIMTRRRGLVRVGFEGDAETEYQTVFDGKIEGEELTDDTYSLSLEENLSKYYRDIPFTPIFLGTYPNAATADVGKMIPMCFGRVRNFAPPKISVPSSIWLFNDAAYGRAKAVKAVRIGARSVGAASYTANTTAGTLTLTFATSSGLMLDVDGYRDDADGTYTGTPTALIEQPSDVYRFVCKKVLGMTVDELDEAALDTARTTWAGFRVGRALETRQSSFQLLTSGPARDGLAENIHGYFYHDNISGKARLISQARDTTGATSGNYRDTGANANIAKGSYLRRTLPRNLMNDCEVAFAYGAASGLYKDYVKRRDTTSSADTTGYGKQETVRLSGAWIPADVGGVLLQYVGTAAACTCTILGEDDDASQTLRTTTTNHASENLSLDLTAAAYDTLTELKDYLDGLAAYTASIATSANGSLPSKGLRDLTARDIKTSQRTLNYSWGKLLAIRTVDRYKDNHDEVRWSTSLVGFTQRLADVVSVKSLGESTARRVRVYETRRLPLQGRVDITGEIE